MKTYIKVAREKAQKTQKECADALEITLRAWQGYEQGIREPKFKLLCEIADMFGVTTDYLLGREPKPPEPNPFEEMNLSPDAEKKVLETYNAFPAPARAFLLDVIRQLGNVMNDIPEAQQSSMEYIGTIGEELERREQEARAETEAVRKDTA